MMEILRFVLFLVTTIVLVKVGEDVLLNWSKDSSIDIVEDEEPRTYDGTGDDSNAGSRNKQDDLLQIEGIKPRMVKVLKDAGYTTYKDIELANITNLKRTLNTSFPHISESELKLWAKQASYAIQGRTADLERLKATIARARMTRKIQ